MDSRELDLWSRWTGGRDRGARDALTQRHVAWARLVARDVYLKVRLRGTEWGDYVQNATIGLLEAIDRYDPDRGIEFRTYARHRVRGAVFNGLRHLVSTAQDYRSATVERSASLSGGGTSDQLEAFVSWTVGLGIGHLLEAASLVDEQIDQGRGPYATAVSDQLSDALRRALEQLPEREQMVLTLHYFQHVPFVDIASQLQVTKGRISQIHRQAIETLRAQMKAPFLAEA